MSEESGTTREEPEEARRAMAALERTVAGVEGLELTDPGRTLRTLFLRGSGSTVVRPIVGRSVASDSLPGELTGEDRPYEVLRQIGRGGMGIVYLARQGDLGREVALKAMRTDVRDPGSMRVEFVSEAMVTGALDHPNIVPVHALHADGEDAPYFAMKFVGGRPWSQMIREEGADQAPLSRHLEILRAVCNAVAFAHSRGVLHRDLKTENVMVGEFGEVLVMDWGLACRIGDEDPAKPDLPSRAVVACHRHAAEVELIEGTPSYMAPEMAEARGADFGPWTDVYLLGGILHEILTGRPPHRRADVRESIKAAARSAPPEFDHTVPGGLASICRRALAREPEARFRSVGALLQALVDYERHRESDEIAGAAGRLARQARDESNGERAYAIYQRSLAAFEQAIAVWSENESAAAALDETRRAFAALALSRGDLGLARSQIEALGEPKDLLDRLEAATAARERLRRGARIQRRVIAGAAATVIGVLALAVVLITGSRDEERKAKGRALELAARNEVLAEAESAARGRAEADAERAREVSRFLVGLFKESDPIALSGRAFGARARGIEELSARDILDRGARQLRGALAQQPLVRAQLLDTIADVYLTLGLADEAAPLHEEALALRSGLLEESSLDLADSRRTAARLASVRGDRAADAFGRVYETRRALLGDDDPSVAWAAFDHAVQLVGEMEMEQAPAALARASELMERCFGPESREFALVRFLRSQFAILDGDMMAATASARDGARIIDALRGNTDFSEALDTFVAAQIASRMGAPEAADLKFDECTAKGLVVLGESHYLLGLVYVLHGEFLNSSKLDLQKAVEVNRKALDFYQRLYGSAHRYAFGRYRALIQALRNASRHEDAASLCLEALDRLDAASAPVPGFRAEMLHSLGLFRAWTDDYEAAEARLREAVAVALEESGAEASQTRRSADVLEQVLLRRAGDVEGMTLVQIDEAKAEAPPHFEIARAHARASALVAPTGAEETAATRFLRERYRAESVAALGRALAAGLCDAAAIRVCPDIGALLDRADLRELLEDRP